MIISLLFKLTILDSNCVLSVSTKNNSYKISSKIIRKIMKEKNVWTPRTWKHVLIWTKWPLIREILTKNNFLWQNRLFFKKVKNSILSKSCRKFSSHHFGPFPDEKILKIDDFGLFLVKWSIFVWVHLWPRDRAPFVS